MIAEIEDAIIARLKTVFPKLTYINIPLGAPISVAGPAYMITIPDGPADPPAMMSLKQNLSIAIWLYVSNLRNDAARRHGAYPIVEAISQCLVFDTLKLDMTALRYKGFVDVSEQEEWQKGAALFRLDFETSFAARKITDADAADLMSAALTVLSGDKPVITGDINLTGETNANN